LTTDNKYRFSFTAASLMVSEMVELSCKLVESGANVASLTADDHKRERAVTSKREFLEIQLRLATLTIRELEFLAEAKFEERKLLCLIAFGRTYGFFKDFIEEVLLEKVSLYDLHLADRDYFTFVNRKQIDHEELDQLANSTKKKIKQVVFKVLEQAGIIDSIKTRNIQIPHIGRAFEKLICQTNPNDLKLLLYTEQRIAAI
jgi:Putative inner membrane protein (DUF1819)